MVVKTGYPIFLTSYPERRRSETAIGQSTDVVSSGESRPVDHQLWTPYIRKMENNKLAHDTPIHELECTASHYQPEKRSVTSERVGKVRTGAQRTLFILMENHRI
jgi:hypothetical protein